MPIVNVNNLASTGGFRIVDDWGTTFNGFAHPYFRSYGLPSFAGDVNGDGIPDILWTDGFADFNNANFAGRGAVIFGVPGAGIPDITLGSLTGSNGFLIDPAGGPFGRLGHASSPAGDVNGDGFDDIVLSVDEQDESGPRFHLVVFGSSAAFSPNVTQASLDGSNGFVITGVQGAKLIGSGDFNGDGYSDVIIGETGSGGGSVVITIPGTLQGIYKDIIHNFPIMGGGTAYVVYGKANGFPALLDVADLNGANGFKIVNFGSQSVASAGDFNGDGTEDFVLANTFVGGTGGAFVVYGRHDFGAEVDLAFLNASLGVYINGVALHDRVGESIASAGDFNGDGFDDLIIGAIQYDSDPADGSFPHATGTGVAYVVFGGASPGDIIELSDLDGSNGFVITGGQSGDLFGIDVSSAGDFNGDGYADIIVSALENASAPSYLIYGRPGGFSATIDVSAIDEATGIVFDQGMHVAGGADINGDGLDDLLLAGATPRGLLFVHPTLFVIHGFALPRNLVGTDLADTLPGAALADSLSGLNGSDLITGRAGADTLDGGAGNDLIDGGDDNDLILAQSGRDSVLGGAGNDSIDAAAGDDSVDGGANNDRISGGTGFDLLLGGNGNDTIQGGTENDTLIGGKGFDYLLGQDGNDSLVGDDLADTLVGGNGSDFLNGGIDNDLLFGDAQHDTIFGDAGDDIIDAGTGNDTVDGGGQRDSVFGGSGFDLIDGGSGNDTLTGGTDGDTLLGGAGFDILQGDAGDDVLNGGLSNDVIFGNAGNDTIIFDLGGGVDTVRDFTSGAASEDVISLTGFGAAFNTFAEVIGAATQTGNHVTIDFGNGDMLVIRNTLVASLHADDFSFG